MNWIDYTKQKPTDKDAQYLIIYGWNPNVSVHKIAQWNGSSFFNFDWDEGNDILYRDKVKYWIKIEKPSANFADVDKTTLTWQDIKRIVEIADYTIDTNTHFDEKSYYTEVLRRFTE